MFVVYDMPWAAEQRRRRAEQDRAQELRDLRDQIEATRLVLARTEARLARLEAAERFIDVTVTPVVWDAEAARLRSRRKTELD